MAVGRRRLLLRGFSRRQGQSGQRETPFPADQFESFLLLVLPYIDDTPVANRGQLQIRVRGLTCCFFDQIIAACGRVGVQFRAGLGASNNLIRWMMLVVVVVVVTVAAVAGRFHLSLTAG